MQVLTVDVGTGTQDVLLFDDERELENCFKLVMPAPTVTVARQVRDATRRGAALLLQGVTMGGGPCHWAVMDHLRAGYRAAATPAAARTFDDDLDAVRASGIEVVSEDEAAGLARMGGVVSLTLGDLWLEPILATFQAFGADAHPDALAVAVFDHGAAPRGVSDRVFRFDYLRTRLSSGRGLDGFAYPAAELPPFLTRLRAVAASAPSDLPLLLMDTAPAAVLGARDDPTVAASEQAVVANVGNFHCLAFHLRHDGTILGLFEHHTGELTPPRLAAYVQRLREGTISNAEVFADKGHGALVLDASAAPPDFLAVTGPRRQLLVKSGLDPYLAVPHGDMMLAGNIGLLRAAAVHLPGLREGIERRLALP